VRLVEQPISTLPGRWKILRSYDDHVIDGLAAIAIEHDGLVVASFRLDKVKRPEHRNPALELAAASWIEGRRSALADVRIAEAVRDDARAASQRALDEKRMLEVRLVNLRGAIRDEIARHEHEGYDVEPEYAQGFNNGLSCAAEIVSTAKAAP